MGLGDSELSAAATFDHNAKLEQAGGGRRRGGSGGNGAGIAGIGGEWWNPVSCSRPSVFQA